MLHEKAKAHWDYESGLAKAKQICKKQDTFVRKKEKSTVLLYKIDFFT